VPVEHFNLDTSGGMQGKKELLVQKLDT
jgi:hypothetical protein